MPRRRLIRALWNSTRIRFNPNGIACILFYGALVCLNLDQIVCRGIPIRLAPGIVSIMHFGFRHTK